MQAANILFTKTEFIEYIKKNIPDDFVIASTNNVLYGEVFAQKNTITLQHEFANEIFKEPYSFYPLLKNGLKHNAIIAGRMEDFISTKWQEGLKNGDGIFGLIIKS